MHRHSFDPISGLLGIVAVAVGALVVGGEIDPVAGTDVAIWITVAGLIVGLLLLPIGWHGAGVGDRPASGGGDHATDHDEGGDGPSESW